MSLSITDDGAPITTATAFDVQESAEMGQVGTGTITVDDSAGTIDLLSHKRVRIGEDDCTDEVLFRGFGGANAIRRGTRRQQAGRTITLNTLDQNAKAGFKVIRGRAWRKRPVESVGERLTDLLASDFVAFHDNGFVDYPDALVDGGDLRGMRPGDVLTDLATRVGFNWFLYWDEDETETSLWFRDSNTSTAYSSSLRISNVIADLDGTTTFEASSDTELTRDPTNLVSGVWMPFKKGNVYRTRAETEETYEPRDGTAPSSRTKRRSRARAIADRYLIHHQSPEDRITTTVLLPSSRVNLIKAGHRVECKFSHYANEGYGDWTWFRVLHRKPSWLFSPGGRPELPGEPLYPVQLTLSPQEAGSPSACPSISQWKSAVNKEDVEVTLDSPVTVGNLLIVRMLGGGGAGNPLPSPTTMADGGWTLVGHADASGDLGGAEPWGTVLVYAKIATSTSATIGRATDGSFMWMTVYEIAGGTLDDITVLVGDHEPGDGNNGSSATVVSADLGDFADATGVAIMGFAIPRGTDQRDLGFVVTPAAGWTETINHNPDGLTSCEAGVDPWIWGGHAVDAASLNAAVAITEGVCFASPNGQFVNEWAGVALLVGCS